MSDKLFSAGLAKRPNSTRESFVREAPKSINSTKESSCSKFARMEEKISISKKEASSLQSETIERYLETASFCIATTSTSFLSIGRAGRSGLFSSSKEDAFFDKMNQARETSVMGIGIYFLASVGIIDASSSSFTWDGSSMLKIKLDCTGIAKAAEVVLTPESFKTSFKASAI